MEAKLKIPSGYSCANHSFLSSVLKTLPDAPVTLLREHYRCHPDIINFCNRKFYDGKLLIMTERKSNERALSMITTSKGNHARNHENQREIDVIEEEISNSLKEKDDIGLIAPYKDQVKLMGKDLTLLKNNNDNKASTVHAFQGQEKKTIILSVTDDYITEFSDNPNLINVALSRAIEKFHLVVSGNEQKLHGNICDLMDYIRYNNGEVRESALNSIFDNLHRYSSQNYAPGQTESSPAEDLTSELIKEVLRTEFKGANLNYLRHYPLGALIAETGNTNTSSSKTTLSQELKDYVKASGTHLDFLIYNELTKNAVIAVEVDGVSYHKEDSKQYKRDKKKNEVLEICKLPLLRLKTTEHSESERLIKMINDAIGRKEYGQDNPHLHQVKNPQDSNTSSQS